MSLRTLVRITRLFILISIIISGLVFVSIVISSLIFIGSLTTVAIIASPLFTSPWFRIHHIRTQHRSKHPHKQPYYNQKTTKNGFEKVLF